jgi:hypothetical protein
MRLVFPQPVKPPELSRSVFFERLRSNARDSVPKPHFTTVMDPMRKAIGYMLTARLWIFSGASAMRFLQLADRGEIF